MIAALTFNETNNYVIYVCSDTFEASKAYEIFVDSSIGTQLINNTEPGAIYTRVMQNGLNN